MVYWTRKPARMPAVNRIWSGMLTRAGWPAASRRVRVKVWAMAWTVQVQPNQRWMTSAYMPRVCMLSPDRRSSLRQCSGVSGRAKASEKLCTRTSRMSPRASSRSSRAIVASTESPIGTGHRAATRPLRCAASCMALASPRSRAMRAWQNTCFPEFRAAMLTSLCRYGQVPMNTASMSSRSTICCHESQTSGMPN